MKSFKILDFGTMYVILFLFDNPYFIAINFS